MSIKVHILKTDPDPFDANFKGTRFAEIRKNDRDFKVHDFLFLRETVHHGYAMSISGAPLEYTGRTMMVQVTHIQIGYGLGPDWCILSFERVSFSEDQAAELIDQAGTNQVVVFDEPFLPHQHRLLAEEFNLVDKTTKLETFLAGPVFPTLGSVAQNLLREQHTAMDTYCRILRRRIDNGC